MPMMAITTSSSTKVKPPPIRCLACLLDRSANRLNEDRVGAIVAPWCVKKRSFAVFPAERHKTRRQTQPAGLKEKRTAPPNKRPIMPKIGADVVQIRLNYRLSAAKRKKRQDFLDLSHLQCSSKCDTDTRSRPCEAIADAFSILSLTNVFFCVLPGGRRWSRGWPPRVLPRDGLG
jgi:hypothetical protein